MKSQSRARSLALVAGGTALLIALAACSGPAGSGSTAGASGGGGATNFSFLVNTENTTIPKVLDTLGKGACSADQTALPLKVETVPQTELDQKLQLLGGQSALPAMFAAGNSPTLTKELAKNGQVLDIGSALTTLGVADQILPSAKSTIEQLYGGFNALPFEYNIEGIWYNKALFTANGVSTPSTWTDLVAAAQKFKDAGVTPFAASGEQGWPITRLISGYIFRDQGPDALQKVADKRAKLTDPEYVKAAQAIADLGAKGYFSEGVGSIDYDTAFNQFLTGKAAMFYMGSWALSNFADATKNQVGSDNIAFMPFPAVTGGKGDINAYPANVGLPMTLGKTAYNDKVGGWLACIAKNYGATALSDASRISGFKVNSDVKVDALTKVVQDTMSSSKSSVLWFEALFGPKATTASQTNAAQLVSGAMSAQDFMKTVQAAIDSE